MLKKLIINTLFIIYLEFLYGILIYSEYLKNSIINILIFSLLVGTLITLITSLFKEKANKIINIIIYSLLGIIFNINFVFTRVFTTTFTFSLFTLVDQAIGFGGEAMEEILLNGYGVILFFIPLILSILFSKKIGFERYKIKDYIILILVTILTIGIYFININNQKESYGAHELIYKLNNQTLAIQKLGVINSSIIDINKTLFGFNEEIKEEEKLEEEPEENSIFTYDDNNLDYDFSKYTSNDNDIQTLNKYLSVASGTKKNEYTGVFENYNIVYITAESFSELAVSEELTPTLYKLVNNGFHFSNFYTSYSLSTIGGEFQSLTGLYASMDILKTFRSGNVSFPYGLGTIFKNSGYNTYAYHNHSATFQDRDKYLRSMGFTNYKACRNGLEKVMNCSHWPNSDIEMIDSTYKDYINSDKPFLAYYMTVSGHMNYTYGGNHIVQKNWDKVKDLNYSSNVKGYLATQIELDKALESLLQKLEEAGKLDNTVIVLVADHYPYALSLSEVNELSTYERDSVVGVNHNNLIIWNNRMKKIEVEKPAMSIDVIPTVYNLFGLKYDSRLFIGNDILSTAPGLAIFSDMSWATKNGIYYSKTGNYTGTMTSDYINNMNSVVKNRVNISRLIIAKNYYNYLLNQRGES